MPPHQPPLPPPPQPTKIFFDPFNSSATGHQRAQNYLSGSTSWRKSRTYKLAYQFGDASGRGGNQHLSDLVGAGSENFSKDGQKENRDGEKNALGSREKGWQDIRSMMGGSKKRRVEELGLTENNHPAKRSHCSSVSSRRSKNEIATVGSASNEQSTPPISKSDVDPTPSPEEARPPQIFRSLNLYLNGSTGPLVSDHRLKQLWVQHGGSVSIGLGRRTVTHVILGETGWAGGGLASGKIQKEVTRVGGKGVKYVTVKWVLDSIDRGKRLSEAGYAVTERIGGARQSSVRTIFGAQR